MNILAFTISVSILYAACLLATIYATPTKWRVKRADKNILKNNISENEEETVTETSNFNTAVSDACNVSINANSEEGRVRRNIQYKFRDLETTTEAPEEATIDLSIFSAEFLNCTHIYVEPECYKKLHNGSVYVPLYNMLFDRSNYIINQKLLFICPDFFDEYLDTEKFSVHIPIVSLVGTIISGICIVMHIVMFAIVKKLRNLPGYCLLSLCIALLSAYLSTFVQYGMSGRIGCTLLGMALLYYFLASFFWMNTMAYDVWKSIRMATSQFRLNTNRPIMVQFARYSLYAWGTPMLIVLIAVIVNFSAPETSKYRLTFNLSNCWFKYKQALTLYFAGPLFVLIGMNVLFFTSSFVMILSASMRKSHVGPQGNSDLWSRLFLSLRLASVMGLMWLFGILATLTTQEWIWYLYSVCSALQGVFIFFSFTVSERTRKVCMKAFKQRKSSTPTQTSSQQLTSFNS